MAYAGAPVTGLRASAYAVAAVVGACARAYRSAVAYAGAPVTGLRAVAYAVAAVAGACARADAVAGPGSVAYAGVMPAFLQRAARPEVLALVPAHVVVLLAVLAAVEAV